MVSVTMEAKSQETTEQEKLSKKYESIYNKGEKLYENGDYLKALYYFQQAIPLSPEDNSNALTHTGLACMKLNWYASAVEYLKKAVDVNATFFSVSSLANAYLDLGESEMSEYYNDMILNTDPTFNVSLNNVGIIYYDRGNLDKALDLYRKAMQTEADFIPSLHNIGELYSYTENWDSASYYFDKVLAINPKTIESNIGMVEKQEKTGSNYNEYCKTIITETSKKLKKNPQDYNLLTKRAFAYKHLGNTTAMTKDLEQSLVIINELLDLHPSSYVFLASRAEIYDMLGDKQKAIADYQKVMEYMPKHPDAIRYMKENKIE